MRVVLDSSALVCIHIGEPDADLYMRVLAGIGEPVISAVNAFETRMVLLHRKGKAAVDMLDQALNTLAVRIAPFDAAAAAQAFAAHRRFGKGSGHAAKLNLADCAAYALAKASGAPLLFKGNDFHETDVTPALPLLLSRQGGPA